MPPPTAADRGAANCVLLVIGHRSALRGGASAAARNAGRSPRRDAPALAFLAAGEERAPIRFGEIAPEAGRFAYLAVERAVELAQAGRIDAIVTAPLNKEALNLAGYHYAGHTDMLAALTNTRSSVMLLAHGDMRVGHVTTHVALADVPKLLTPERLRRTIDLTHAAVRDLGHRRAARRGGGAQPARRRGRAVRPAGHRHHRAGGGAMPRRRAGRDRARCRATRCSSSCAARQFDAVVAMYHDQGHIPVKLLGFDVDPATGTWRALSGVNITLGLPVIRTSVDHGTAFDIAGTGIANEESLIEAIDYAERLAARRPPRHAGKCLIWINGNAASSCKVNHVSGSWRTDHEP